MGRSKKFQRGQVVRRTDGTFGVVIDHKTYADGSTAYRIVRSDRYGNTNPKAAWVRSTKLQPVVARTGEPRKAKWRALWRRYSRK